MPDVPHHPAPPAAAILTDGDFRTAVAPILPVLDRYARRLVGTTDIDDLVQDTLLKAWAARASFRPGSNLRAWLIRIARNTFLSGRRRAGRQVLWEADDLARALVTASDQETPIMLADLGTAIANLPDRQRRAFELVAVERLSYEDAAGRLGVELGTLKSLTSRARAALAETLDPPAEAVAAAPPPADPPRPAARPASATIYRRWKASGGRVIGLPPAAATA